MERCVFCRIITSRRCNICNTYYCSNECEHKNKKAHKIYCFPELHQRLKSILNFVYKNTTISNAKWTLSHMFLINNLSLIAYGIHDIKYYCAICGKTNSSMYDMKWILLKNNCDGYRLCSDCDDKKICNISFMESEKCKNIQKSIVTLLLCLKFHKIQKDIRTYILKQMGPIHNICVV